MPVRIVGIIGVTPPSNDTTLYIIEGGLSPSDLTCLARDEADFDLASFKPKEVGDDRNRTHAGSWRRHGSIILDIDGGSSSGAD